MKKLACLLIFAWSCLNANAQSPEWNWARSGPVTEKRGIAVDAWGNSYIAIRLDSTIVFGGQTIPCDTPGLALLKWNGGGGLVWGRMITKDLSGSTYGPEVAGITVDPSGNVLIAGELNGPQLTGNDTLAGSAFVLKTDSAGSVEWGRAGDATIVFGIGCDAAGGVAINGYTYGAAEFDTVVLPAINNQQQIVTAKFSSNGDVLWARHAGGGGGAAAYGVAMDKAGNVYAPGSFRDTIFIGQDTLYNSYAPPGPSMSHSFIVQYTPSGSVGWVKPFDQGGICFNASANDSGLYVAGQFTDTLSVDGITIIRPPANSFLGAAYGFVGRFSHDGEAQWLRSIGNNQSDVYDGVPWAMTTDEEGSVYALGIFRGDTLLVDGVGVVNMPGNAVNARAQYLIKYRSDGSFDWAQITRCTPGFASVVGGLACHAPDDLAVTNTFYGVPDFGGALNPLPTANLGLYVGRLGGPLRVTGAPASADGVQVYPNPAAGTVSIRLPERGSYHTATLLNANGQPVRTQALGSATSLQWDVRTLPAGQYFVRLDGPGTVAVQSLSVVH